MHTDVPKKKTFRTTDYRTKPSDTYNDARFQGSSETSASILDIIKKYKALKVSTKPVEENSQLSFSDKKGSFVM